MFNRLRMLKSDVSLSLSQVVKGGHVIWEVQVRVLNLLTTFSNKKKGTLVSGDRYRI